LRPLMRINDDRGDRRFFSSSRMAQNVQMRWVS
jgi:hypothetical protein